MRLEVGAAVIAGTLETRPASLVIEELRASVQVPAIRRQMRAIRAPLDLDAEVFRYRVTAGEVVALRTRRAGHACSAPHHRR